MKTRARPFDEVDEEVELGGREVHEVVAVADPPGRRLERDRTELERRGRERGPSLDPAQQRVDPGHELAGAERLGEVVVGADLQADDEVGLGVTRR